MTKNEFLNYLYNNSDDLNPLLITEFLFQHFRGFDKQNNLALHTTKPANYFGLKVFVSNNFHVVTGGVIHYNDKFKQITVNGCLEYDKQRYIILTLLFEYFKNYKKIMNGYQFTSALIFNELPNQNKFIIEVLEEEKSKIINFSKKY